MENFNFGIEDFNKKKAKTNELMNKFDEIHQELCANTQSIINHIFINLIEHKN